MIKDFKEGTTIAQTFLVKNVSKSISTNSSTYLSITLQDKSGTIEARKWASTKEDDEIYEVDSIVSIKADVITYQGKLQIKINEGSKIDSTLAEYQDYLPEAPVSKDELLKDFTHYLGAIKNDQISNVVNTIFKTRIQSFSAYPAASKNHHEYYSGLLHHTVTMLKLSDAIMSVYPDINKDYVYAGIILHDVGKLVELTGPASPAYTVEGKLLGHISIANALIYETCQQLKVDHEIEVMLQHLVLSHHGEKEFGSPVSPLTKEAELIHHIDDLDSKLNMIDKALKDTEEGEFSQRVPGLDNRSFYKTKKI